MHSVATGTGAAPSMEARSCDLRWPQSFSEISGAFRFRFQRFRVQGFRV